jgi:HSP20 family protein
MRMPTPLAWSPLAAFRALQSQLEAVAVAQDLRHTPPVNVLGREDRVLVQALVPGLAPEALRIEVDGDTLSLAGEWPAAPVEGVRAEHVERPRGPFERRLRLPFEIDASRVEARLADGVLEIEITRSPQATPQRIAVRSASTRRN